ncbi:Methyltransferase [Lachnellula willkommii]|uniref:Methyltransferase n=1 Tax=Lachnellula willkommii TaxID=215461 RepID=A0A559MDX8_9HELO|nr:Methyltransferase [Lachnellula willkommii]
MSSSQVTQAQTSELVPADQTASKRLLDQHQVEIDALGGSLLQAPIELSRSNLKILDSATADGHWLQELRTQCTPQKNNKYIGIDLNPKFLPLSYPPDFEFYTHNIGEPWPESEHSTFDLVHQRLSLPGAAPYPLSQAVHNIFQLVKPGGWIQLVEAEQIAPDSGPVFVEFLELVKDVFNATGAGWEYAKNLKGWLEAEGAVDIGEISVDMCLGATNKEKSLIEKGASSTAGAMRGLVMHAKAMHLKTDLTDEQLDTLPDRLYAELLERGAHYPLRAVWGRKKRENEA